MILDIIMNSLEQNKKNIKKNIYDYIIFPLLFYFTLIMIIINLMFIIVYNYFLII